MEGVAINFNMDVAELQELGVDVTTSEGKAYVQQMFLDALANNVAGFEGTHRQVMESLLKE